MVGLAGEKRLMRNVMPNGCNAGPILITTSWDDGEPADLRLADLLEKHGIAGTFYVPSRNVEGRAVMPPSEIRRLGQHFEIGGHTRDHIMLTQLKPDLAAQQIDNNKKWLEDLLGREVSRFAYVRGHHNSTIRRLVREAGFRHARTAATFSDTEGPDPYRVPTTMQFFPHRDDTYLWNYLKGGHSLRRLVLLRAVIGGSGLLNRLHRAAEVVLLRGGCFHLWGHSWELKNYDLWDELDSFLAHLRQLRGSGLAAEVGRAGAPAIARAARAPHP